MADRWNGVEIGFPGGGPGGCGCEYCLADQRWRIESMRREAGARALKAATGIDLDPGIRPRPQRPSGQHILLDDGRWMGPIVVKGGEDGRPERTRPLAWP